MKYRNGWFLFRICCVKELRNIYFKRNFKSTQINVIGRVEKKCFFFIKFIDYFSKTDEAIKIATLVILLVADEQKNIFVVSFFILIEFDSK